MQVSLGWALCSFLASLPPPHSAAAFSPTSLPCPATLFCRIPEIGVRVVRQGALPILENTLHFKSGHAVKLIREKSLYALAWLTRIDQDEVGGMIDLGTPEVGVPLWRRRPIPMLTPCDGALSQGMSNCYEYGTLPH